MKTQPITKAPQGLPRRAFLTGLAATLPIATAIAAPALAAPQPDAEIGDLTRLRDRWRQLDAQTLSFENRLAELEGAYLAIVDQPPSGLLIRAEDFELLKEFCNGNRWKGLTHFDAGDIQAMRRRRAMRYNDRYVAVWTRAKDISTAPTVEPIGTLGIDYDIHRTREPWPLAQQRKDSLVAAFDEWQADKKALRASMGVGDAEEALEEHQDEVDNAVMAVVNAPATSTAALQMKAWLMAEWRDDNGDPFENWRTIVLMKAILTDIANLHPAN